MLTAYARNSAGQMLYRNFSGGAWAPIWSQLCRPADAVLDSSPVAMRHYASRHVATRGVDGLLYSRAWSPETEW